MATKAFPRVASDSRADLDRAFQDILAKAMRFCAADSGCIVLGDTAGFELVSIRGVTPAYADFLRRGPIPTGPASALGRVAAEPKTLHLSDLVAESAYLERVSDCVAAVELEGARTALHVPLLQADTLIGIVTLYRRERRPFTDEHTALARIFAGQAVIAIENLRLLRALETRNQEVSEALERQTATGEVLRVISSSPTDVQPVFEMIAKNAVHLCKGQFSGVFQFDGERVHLVAHQGLTSKGAEFYERTFPRPPGRDTTIGRAIVNRATVQIPDVRVDTEFGVRALARALRIRCIVAVPMLREGNPVGGIVVWRSKPDPFTDNEIKLVATFADQAVIAIENVRLFQELEAKNRGLTEALKQQTATAEILRVISSSPTDALPVFEAIVRNAAALCGSLFANVFRFDGELLHYVASHNTGPSYVELLQTKYPMRPDVSQVSGRAILSRSIVRLEDARADPDYDQRFPSAMGWRRMLGVPMLREGKPLGVIVVGWVESGPIPKVQEELLKTFADQAVIAIENVRLFDEIQDKSRQLGLANTYKSRFLAAASHDLRQPLHALNLFVAELQAESDPNEQNRLVARIASAVGGMNELFSALLDVSRLEAGVLELHLTEFPVEQLLKRLETTFAEAAREKGLRLRVVSSGAWVRSDFILLERIMLNLVSNAVRYTACGGVVIGCRHRGERLRLEVWDSGAGIPEDQQQNIFDEFYRLEAPEPNRRGGLGLGLAIVDRLGRLLGNPVELTSILGKGSRFSVSVPLVAERHGPAEAPLLPATITDPVTGKLIVVIDDDALVLDAMRGILRSWGCSVIAAASDTMARARITEIGQQPDLIISDYRLADGKSGIQAIESLRGALGVAVPAFLISGDTAPERLLDASASGYHLLHKPVSLMTLRAMLNRLLKPRDDTC